MEDKSQVLTRKELYGLVWSISMVALSKKYSISDNGLRKICKRMNIPLPGNGHWVKLQFGKRVRVKPLYVDESVEQTVTLSLRTEDENLIAAQGNPLKKLKFEMLQDTRLSFAIPEKLKTKDPLILAAKMRLTGKEASHSYNYKDAVECSRDELDIRVGTSNVGRALRFMDTFLKLLRGRGHGIIIKNGETSAVVKGQELKMKFREKFKRVIVNDRSWGNTELHPTGILSLSVEGWSGKEWKDKLGDGGGKSGSGSKGSGGSGKRGSGSKGPGRLLESYLPEILAWMEIRADRDNEKDSYYRKRREEREQLERVARELKEGKVREIEAFRELLEKAERWHKAVNLRRYIGEVERRGGMPGSHCRSERADGLELVIDDEGDGRGSGVDGRSGSDDGRGNKKGYNKNAKDLHSWLDWGEKRIGMIRLWRGWMN